MSTTQLNFGDELVDTSSNDQSERYVQTTIYDFIDEEDTNK